MRSKSVMFKTVYTVKSAIALIVLSVLNLLSGITLCNVGVVDAFHPQQPLCKTPFSEKAAIISNLIRPRDQPKKTSAILAFRASDENQFAPSEDNTDFAALEEAEDDGEYEHDELVSSLTDKLEQAEGMWYSDDFYGPHGREWVKVSATLVGTGTSALVAVKITGDANIPAGCTTWQTLSWPQMGDGVVPAEIQVRPNSNDPNGFMWIAGKLEMVEEDQIVLSVRFSLPFEMRGTFYKQNDDEDRE